MKENFTKIQPELDLRKTFIFRDSSLYQTSLLLPVFRKKQTKNSDQSENESDLIYHASTGWRRDPSPRGGVGGVIDPDVRPWLYGSNKEKEKKKLTT